MDSIIETPLFHLGSLMIITSKFPKINIFSENTGRPKAYVSEESLCELRFSFLLVNRKTYLLD